MSGPRIDSYEWAGGREAMVRFDPENGVSGGPVVVLALPLFEEANRTRAFGVGLLRALAARGIGGVLPDLPGQGESERAIADLSVLDLQSAYNEAVGQAGLDFGAYGLSIRSGALLDALGLLAGRWRFAPQRGVELLNDLRRLRQIATGSVLDKDHWWIDGTLPEDAPDPPVEIAGNLIGASLLTDLTVKEPLDEPTVPRRTVRLDTDLRPADRLVPGEPLWRQSDPGNNPALIEVLAADIAQWIATCAG
ncbi:hypothetical protein [Sphingomonas sp.]|uniref:hypothetical protein n=1 Tax=Sphingomonas sp. TaxID=28214 RepID=UPI003CC68638